MINIAPSSRALDASRPPGLQTQVETSYTGEGTAEFLGNSAGKSGAFNVRVSLFAPIPVAGDWVIPLGLSSQNLSLNTVAGVPIPGGIHTLSLTTGLGHRLSEDWMVMGMLSPTLYRYDDVGRQDLGVSGGVNAMWTLSPSLAFRFGVLVAPDSDIPVLPLVGVDWHFAPRFELRLLFPQPRLIYRTGDRWSVHVGLDIVGTTFRTDGSLGTSLGMPEYNHALGTYRDVRVGAGAGWRFGRSMSLDVEAGGSVSRGIDYTDVGESVDFAPAPYARLGINLGF